MPLYEYRCPKEHRTEISHDVDAAPAVRCEVCGRPMRRVFSPPNVHTQFYFSASVTAPRRPRDPGARVRRS